jgi:polar amino acid transport system substrate-binding protein
LHARFFDFPDRLLALLVAIVALVSSGCALDHNAAGDPFRPVKPGTLTVATAFLPAPGFWEGSPPTRGFEAGLAAAVVVQQVPFSEMVTGHLHGADIALSQLTPTSQREQVLDFSDPYLRTPPAVLARAAVSGSEPDIKSIRGLRWVTARYSTLTPIVASQVFPTRPPIVVDDRSEALGALRAGRAQAVLLDLPVALALARDNPLEYQVLGQLPGNEYLAAALPQGSPNVQIVDSAINALQSDGTIGQLADRWLGQSSDVPLIRTEA